MNTLRSTRKKAVPFAKIPEVTARVTYAVREVIKIGVMVDGETYFAKQAHRGRSVFIDQIFNSGGISADLESAILSKLKCANRDKVECFLSFRKVND